MKAHAKRHTGFTLTELLVAIGLIVVLMLAVNVIFTTTANTVGSGQALSGAMRDLRSVQAIIKKDLDGAAISDGPFFMIRSSVQTAFKNQKDQLADVDQSVLTVDLTGAGEGPITVTDYGTRTFRTDFLGFFSGSGQVFQRQTGTDAQFAAPMASSEAYVWYGHLWLPTNDPTSYNTFWFTAPPSYAVIPWGDSATFPGAGTALSNPNNFYASQWALGRQAMLLIKPTQIAGPLYVIYDNTPASAGGPVQQYYIGRATAAPVTSLAPLSVNSRWTFDGTMPNANWVVQNSRFDLVGTTIADYRRILTNAITDVMTPLPNWWDNNHFGYRFQANPSPARPLTSASAARTSPIFVPGCAQFIVEYAGDFVAQNPAGDVTNIASPIWVFNTGTNAYEPVAVTGGGTDGVIDYVVDTATGARRIRWYGLPRNVDTSDDPSGGATIVGDVPGDPNGGGRLMLDVVPLSDLLWSCRNATIVSTPTLVPAGRQFVGAPFERIYDIGTGAALFTLAQPNYAATMTAAAQYICAWGPDTAAYPKPKMVRILIKPEDPNGKIDLPWQEMIFNLP